MQTVGHLISLRYEQSQPEERPDSVHPAADGVRSILSVLGNLGDGQEVDSRRFSQQQLARVDQFAQTPKLARIGKSQVFQSRLLGNRFAGRLVAALARNLRLLPKDWRKLPT